MAAIAKVKVIKSRATACNRCKRRKQKCDHRIPQCTACFMANAECVQPEKYSEAASMQADSKFSELLKKRISQLEEENAKLRAESKAVSPSAGGPNSSNTLISLGTGVVGSTGPANVTSSSNFPGQFPPPFRAVYSTLQDKFWGKRRPANDPANELLSKENGIVIKGSGGGTGLLYEYDFSNFKKTLACGVPPDPLADKLIEIWYGHCQTRAMFLDRLKIKKLHLERNLNAEYQQTCQYNFDRFILFIIYATASITLETMTSSRECKSKMCKDVKDTASQWKYDFCLDSSLEEKSRSEYHHFKLYSKALSYLDRAGDCGPIEKITALTLCAIFQMRSDRDDGAHYRMINQAGRLCAKEGLHREECYQGLSLYEAERRRRLFWAIYAAERLMAFGTGQCICLKEAEITVPLPSEACEADLLSPAMSFVSGDEFKSTKEYEYLFYILQLRRIEGEIKETFYPIVDDADVMREKYSNMKYFYSRLKEWQGKRADYEKTTSVDKRPLMEIGYSKAVRMLVVPMLAILEPKEELFLECIKETGNIASLIRDFYKSHSIGFNTLSINTVHVCGLTLLYLLWLSRDYPSLVISIIEHLRVCSNTLYIIAERTKIAVKFRNTLDHLVGSAIAFMKDYSESHHQLVIKSETSPPSSSVTGDVDSPAVVETIPAIPNNIGMLGPHWPPFNIQQQALAEQQTPIQQVSDKQVMDEYMFDNTSLLLVQDPTLPWMRQPGLDNVVPEFLWSNSFTDFTMG